MVLQYMCINVYVWVYICLYVCLCVWLCIRSVIDTKDSDVIAMKSHSNHSGIGKMLILINAYFVISLQCNKMTK